MKKNLILGIILAIALLFGAGSVLAVPVQFTVTGDNLVNAWWKDGAGPVPLDLTPDLDNSLKNWRVADSFVVNLLPGHHYQIIWEVVNDDNDSGFRPPGSDNPGGFLAQIASPDITFTHGSLLSSTSWQVAVKYGSGNTLPTPPGDFNTELTWNNATSYGINNSGSGNIWSQNISGGTVPGMDPTANWIWTAQNFGDTGAPGVYDAVFFKVEFNTAAVPEPGTLMFFASGLLGLGFAYRRWNK